MLSTLASSQPHDAVTLHEVSPRDGLQNESTTLSTDDKVALVAGLVAAGLTDIEVTAFVRSTWIPQLADAADVVARLPVVEGVRYWGLVPNRHGLERAMDAGLRHVATVMSASETHNKKNLNRTRRESLTGLREVIGEAKDAGLTVRAYLSTVFGCPYEGAVDPLRSRDLALEMMAAGADYLALGDTTGMANPRQVQDIVALMVQGGIPLDRLALHMHDTRGTALANVLAGFDAGVRTFDGSIAGVGGCPYAPGAAGNLATEDLVYMLDGMGVATGVDLPGVAGASRALAVRLGRELPSRWLQAGPFSPRGSDA